MLQNVIIHIVRVFIRILLNQIPGFTQERSARTISHPEA
jgi:hypothetical protein